MRIDQILAGSEEPVFSFEFFPPKSEEGEATLQETLRTLRALEPSFVSVTYGAGGSTRERTVELTKWIKRELGIEAMAHLSCVGTTREELIEILDQVRASGIENVLALRGDPPRGETEWRPTPGGLSYSTELAQLISDRYDFCVGAACFPEVHPEAPDLGRLPPPPPHPPPRPARPPARPAARPARRPRPGPRRPPRPPPAPPTARRGPRPPPRRPPPTPGAAGYPPGATDV